MAPSTTAAPGKTYRTRRSVGATSPSAAAPAANGSRYSLRRASMATNGGNGAAAATKKAAPAAPSKPKPPSKWGVLFYLPNIIGYLRVVCTLFALYLGVQKREGWENVVAVYFAGFALDAVDGYVARLVGQESQFGAVLDMITDRTATAGLCMVNMAVETCERKKFGWICLVMLDIGSHWAHCMSVKGHHKSDAANKHKNLVLRAYYAVKPLFVACCLGQEVFYLTNFVLAKTAKKPTFGVLMHIPAWVPAPVAEHLHPLLPFDSIKALWHLTLVLGGIKQLVNLAQLCSAFMALAEADAKKKGTK